ncbi:MAG: LCP family protein [Anaerolineae bacterium]|nr:LCP family protein [Anaerolineae bacterium]MDQ7036610.1 LCP family protein [Anaerolineae bacterium]
MQKIIVTLLLLIISIGIIPTNAQQSDVTIPTDALRWDGASRFNVLILGMDRRPGARNNLNARTDAIMLVSFDPQTKTLGILDIPRDMHMAILEIDEEMVRVNTLLVRGESRAEGFGPYYAMQTIQLNFGMYIDAYIAFDFVAFIEFIDAIGGITVDVPVTINDPNFPDMNYGYAPLLIRRGINNFDGRTALSYARTRHNDNDYLRGQRQLDVVMAVRDRLSEASALADLVQNAPQLFDALSSNFYTNIAYEDIVRLGLGMVRLDAEDITSGSLNEQYSFTYRYRGERVRVPDRELLSQLLVETFGEEYWR